MAFSAAANFNTSFSDINAGLFGTDIATNQSGDQSSSQNVSQRGSERLKIDKVAIDKIIQDILGGDQGLAAIFSEEQGTGLFKTTQAQDAVGDLLAKVAGEIARITAVKETESSGEQTAEQSFTSKSEQESSGILDSVLGGLF